MINSKALTNLPALVAERFAAAKAANELNFYSTQVAIVHCGEGRIPFQIRFSPALANKPKSNKPHDNSKPFDPFEDPSKALLVCELAPSHNVVLNKFAVVPEHFILATKEFKEQTHLLEESDLAAAYACVKAYRDHGKLFAFFNSGEHSGASQPHRHIQFLPVKSMREGVESGTWDPLADSLQATSEPAMPFAYFASGLPKDPSSTALHSIYKKLYHDACAASKAFAGEQFSSDSLSTDEYDVPSIISYNIGLTDDNMVLCPRQSEGRTLETEDGKSIGPIALNGTLLAGTLLVKSEPEWNALRSDETKLASVLEAIGIPSST
ncbi:putative bis(5'-nucleosyl)-tetraphosphatase [Phlyctema vagabunda]|uniref:Bis(5'-nucleosyl)-tetraphosphatase n=1 Tax=Phlyctema vagabunda TaxID=108571 RepID=A0ABR4P8V2_9HELO